jgi:phosphoglycolate phosphatase
MKHASNLGETLPWSSRQFDGAILDLDGTMVDTVGDFVAALQRMLQDLPAPFHAYTVTAPVVQQLVGRGSENLIKSLLALIGQALTAPENIANHCFDQALASYQRHYAEVNGQHARVYAGVVQGLQDFRALGWRMACVTNKPTAFARDLLQHLRLDEFFVLTLGGDTLPYKKPHPLPLETACRLLGVDPQRTLMVGDSSNDAQAARAAGCPVLLVTYGYNHGEPIRDVDADAFTDSLAGLRWRSAV